MKLVALPIAALLAGCATSVVHPTKSAEEMRADVAACTNEANATHQWEPFAALDYAYACLAKLGYQRETKGFEAQVQREVTADRVRKSQPPLSCVVPCRPGRRQ